MQPKDMTNEELAAILLIIGFTGINPSTFEKECLYEAATRLQERESKDGYDL